MIPGLLSGFLTGEFYMFVLKSFFFCVLNLRGGKLHPQDFR